MSAAAINKDCANKDTALGKASLLTQFIRALPKYNQRPFPWNLAPDNFWTAWGMLMLVCISVPGISMILCTEVCAQLLFPLKKTALGGKVYQVVYDAIESVSKQIGKVVLKDQRNWSFLPWTIIEAIALPLWFYFLAYRRYIDNGFEWWVALLYHFMRLGPKYMWFSHHHVLIHKEGHDHKGFFKGPFAALNCINSLWTGFFYGSMFNSYAAGHNKIHHRWHNDCDDVHSNLDVDRSKFSSYILWLPRFTLYWTGISPLALFLYRSEYKLAWDILQGQIWWLCGMSFIVYKAGFFFMCLYFVYPMMESIAFLGTMAYLWHAFVDPQSPRDCYVNSITILNGKDNIWNEDYHVVHHHAPFVHWSDVPAHYEKTVHRYAEVTASVFRDCEEGEMVYWLFANKWDLLAEHFVDLNGKLTHEEKKAMLLERLRYQRLVADKDDGVGWANSEIRDWDTVSKEQLDAESANKKQN